MTETPPSGFSPHFRQSKFTDPWEPLYSQTEDDQVRIGVILRDVHCNSREFVHGGFIASIADNAMGLSCIAVMNSQTRASTGLITVSLSTDYVGAAKVGAWLQTDTTVLKIGGSLCFANCLITSGKEIVARASATFKIVGKAK
ncbi:MAG: PaaI family thioesterase [Proteobacteria bacterium]|nr:PaaI family thioesterase [Pseudomonadota bacterium]